MPARTGRLVAPREALRVEGVYVRPRRQPMDEEGRDRDVDALGDALAKDRELPPFVAGDLIAVRSAGAYGAVMASTYNSRPLAAEVLVRADQYAVVRPRQEIQDMIDLDRLPQWWD